MKTGIIGAADRVGTRVLKEARNRQHVVIANVRYTFELGDK